MAGQNMRAGDTTFARLPNEPGFRSRDCDFLKPLLFAFESYPVGDCRCSCWPCSRLRCRRVRAFVGWLTVLTVKDLALRQGINSVEQP